MCRRVNAHYCHLEKHREKQWVNSRYISGDPNLWTTVSCRLSNQRTLDMGRYDSATTDRPTIRPALRHTSSNRQEFFRCGRTCIHIHQQIELFLWYTNCNFYCPLSDRCRLPLNVCSAIFIFRDILSGQLPLVLIVVYFLGGFTIFHTHTTPTQTQNTLTECELTDIDKCNVFTAGEWIYTFKWLGVYALMGDILKERISID